MSDVDIDTLISRRRSRLPWILSISAVVLIGIGVAAFLLLRPDGSDVVPEPQRAEASMGQLSKSVELSGTAAAERSGGLSFETSGAVAAVSVEAGDSVRAGDDLASLDDVDAQLRIETAQVQLRLAQLRLEALLADPEAAELASARQAIESAESQVASAEEALAALLEPASASELANAEEALASALGQLSAAEEALVDLLQPPSASELASAEEAVASALGQLSGAQEAVADLLQPPGASELASAEEAVASALGQLSGAEEALVDLLEPPSAGELASAEEAMATALGQLASSEQALADLLEGPTDTEIASGRTSLTDARAQLTRASDEAEDSWHALSEAFDEFCEIYGSLRVVGMETCSATLPLSDDQLAVVRDPLYSWGATYEQYANDLIRTNVSYVVDEAARQSAIAALSSAEDRLAELIAPVSEEDLLQAELSVQAARASHASAVARLDDLKSEPTEEDILQAELSVQAARASHTSAVARLDDLKSEPTEEDILQAELSVQAARASHASAVARLDDLRSEPTEEDILQAELSVQAARASHASAVARLQELGAPEGEAGIEKARSSLESANAGLTSARLSYGELLAGATANEIAQQEENVRLAEISLQEARIALDDLVVVAPFDGVVEAVNVRQGDRVTASVVAFSLTTADRMTIELAVTEADLLELEVGQAGLASFDAVDGVEYPVRISSVSRVPNAAQGVVTYEVQARILEGLEIAEVAGDIAILRAGGQGAGSDSLIQSFLGAGGRAGAGGLPAGFDLPEGMTIQDIDEALRDGEPLPEGITLPEGLDFSLEDLQRLAARFLASGGDRDAAGPQELGTARPLPVPGMSASVTILTEVRQPSVLVPVAAVRQLDGAWFVIVPSTATDGTESRFERVTVEVGESDGVSVEITSGLEPGAVLLIGADSAGIAFSATQQQQLPQLEFGGGLPGFGGPEGGGRP